MNHFVDSEDGLDLYQWNAEALSMMFSEQNILTGEEFVVKMAFGFVLVDEGLFVVLAKT